VRRMDSALPEQRLRGRGSRRAAAASRRGQQLSLTAREGVGATLAHGAHLEGSSPAQVNRTPPAIRGLKGNRTCPRLASVALLGLGAALGGARLARGAGDGDLRLAGGGARTV